ncbi:MAG TPA: XrtB/PEP-CTERM-associated transcriptional regulator EpsA, partial [Burkholderiales bacterium]|nr:XrtB/PEP-CTERM-associated transcriptional regulator EpsA [Burkholderiales bacterium]
METSSATNHVHAWSGEPIAAPGTADRTFELTAKESARFLRVVAEGTRITRHYEIYRWLNGELQQFLPHDILICAWGDFSSWNLQFDITSGLPGVRTGQLAHCPVDDLIREAYARWLEGARQPVLLNAAEAATPDAACACAIHSALGAMRSLVVHGVRDARTGSDSLYIALSSGPLTRGRGRQRFVSLAHALIAQVDGAFRKVAVFPLRSAPASPAAGSVLELSEREREILESLREGKTNVDIALALDISPFTVKNHVQRIFRKIGVSNRTQAAARYGDVVREMALRLTRQP